MSIYTYRTNKSISEALGIEYQEIPELSDQELDNIPIDVIIHDCKKDIPSYPIMKGKDHPFYGKKHSEETKKKMSLKKAGIKREPLTEEHKNKLRKPHPTAGVKIAKAFAKDWIVTNKKTGEEFKITNLNQFCRDNNLAPGNLYKTVTGKCHHHKGYAIRHG